MTPEGAAIGPFLARPTYAADMTLPGRSFVVVAFATVIAGCGGNGGAGSTPTGPAVATEACQLDRVRNVVQTCRSPDGRWLLSQQYGKCGTLFFSRGLNGKRMPFRSLLGCGMDEPPGPNAASGEGEFWAKPHLLIIGDNVSTVLSVDPSAGKSRVVAGLSDFLVSPNGQWVAGEGPGDPQVTHQADTVYVAAIRAPGRCLVVPGLADVWGFTADSKNVIVTRYANGNQLRQYAISSLPSGCPTGSNGVLPQNS